MEESFITPNTELRRKYLPSPSTRKDDSYLQYIELLKSHGLEINPKCFPSYFTLKNGLQYPGVAASEKINPNQVLVRVPKKLVLSSFIATQRQELKEIYKERFYHEQWAWQDRVLNTYLLYIYSIQQTSNIWYHTVKHLSKDIDIVGFWPQQELNKFKDLTVKSAAEMDNQSFQSEWSQFQKIKEKHPILQHLTFSKENYRWIFIHLVSRCFGKQLEFTSMVPFCEFFNHHAVDGYYDVEISAKEQPENDDVSSITTEGSYLSEDYIEVGEYQYQQIEIKPYTWQCKEHLDLNEKQKQAVLALSHDLLDHLDNNLNWQDVSILFIPHLIEKCKLIETQYRAGRKLYDKAYKQLKVIEESIQFYSQNIQKCYIQWRGKHFQYKTEAHNKIQQKQNQQQNQKQLSKNGLIEFPTEEKKPYQNFLLLTGKRDQYFPFNQIYFCYGRNSNRTLLLRYGFTLEGNKYEHVWLSFDIVCSLMNYPDTLKKLQQKHLSLRRKFKIKINRLNLLNSWFFSSKKCVEQLFQVKDYTKQIAILNQIEESLKFRHQQFQGSYDLTDNKLSYHQKIKDTKTAYRVYGTIEMFFGPFIKRAQSIEGKIPVYDSIKVYFSSLFGPI